MEELATVIRTSEFKYSKLLDKIQTLIRELSSEGEKEAFKFLGRSLDKAGEPHTIHNPKIYLILN